MTWKEAHSPFYGACWKAYDTIGNEIGTAWRYGSGDSYIRWEVYARHGLIFGYAPTYGRAWADCTAQYNRVTQ